MRLCFPIEENNGFDSAVFGHFGSAPVFLLVDVGSNDMTAIPNQRYINQHGACNPVASLAGQEIDAVIVGGIGGGALSKLNNAGIRVLQARGVTVAENIALFRGNALPEYSGGGCDHGGHGGHGHGCSH